VGLVDLRHSRQVDTHDLRTGYVKDCRAAQLPEPPPFAEARRGRVDHGLYEASEGGALPMDTRKLGGADPPMTASGLAWSRTNAVTS
jgi:hypothetical protein